MFVDKTLTEVHLGDFIAINSSYSGYIDIGMLLDSFDLNYRENHIKVIIANTYFRDGNLQIRTGLRTLVARLWNRNNETSPICNRVLRYEPPQAIKDALCAKATTPRVLRKYPHMEWTPVVREYLRSLQGNTIEQAIL
jgi:hypothetical protein